MHLLYKLYLIHFYFVSKKFQVSVFDKFFAFELVQHLYFLSNVRPIQSVPNPYIELIKSDMTKQSIYSIS